MSLPSIGLIAKKLGVNLRQATPDQQEQVLLGTMKRDLVLAVHFLEQQFHRAKELGGFANWRERPGSPLGEQLIRLHTSDALRHLAEKHICHGYHLLFFNCCEGVVSKDAMTTEEVIAREIMA